MKNLNLNEAVYRAILDQILSMKFKPGDKINEAKVAAELGASRTPVREALRRLSDDGIVINTPSRSAEVASWDEEKIRQIGMVRINLDFLAIKLACRNGSNADFEEMWSHAEKCRKAAEENNVSQRIREDCAFHCDLSRISKNPQLYEFTRNIYLKIEFLQSWRGVFLQTPEEQYEEHKEIFNILMRRDSAKACEIILHHHVHFHDIDRHYPIEWYKAIASIE